MKKIALCICLLLALPVPLFAYDWQSRNLLELSAANENQDIKLTVLQDQQGRVFSVKNEGPITDLQFEKINSIKDKIFSWQHISVRELIFALYGEQLNIALYPEQFIYKGQDLLTFVPGGLLFNFAQGELRYNFRVVKGDNIVRVKGLFRNETALCQETAETVTNIAELMDKIRPEYLLEQIDLLKEQANKFQEQNKSMASAHELLRQNYMDLWEDHSLLNAEHDLLRKETEQLRKGVLSLHNTVLLFFDKGPVPENILNRVVAIKKEHPATSRKEMQEKLLQEELEISNKEISLIFLLFFNETEGEAR